MLSLSDFNIKVMQASFKKSVFFLFSHIQKYFMYDWNFLFLELEFTGKNHLGLEFSFWKDF